MVNVPMFCVFRITNLLVLEGVLTKAVECICNPSRRDCKNEGEGNLCMRLCYASHNVHL
jgi:hypothetical protein